MSPDQHCGRDESDRGSETDRRSMPQPPSVFRPPGDSDFDGERRAGAENERLRKEEIPERPPTCPTGETHSENSERGGSGVGSACQHGLSVSGEYINRRTCRDNYEEAFSILG